jgi:hypothetical protein
MSINYNNIDELLDLIQKFVYKSEKVMLENYMYKRIQPTDITLYHLVKTNDYDNSEILNEKIKLNLIGISKDSSNHQKILMTAELKKNNCLIILQKDEYNILGTSSIKDIYYELFMNQVISEFIIHEKLPFYLINICNFNVKYNDIIKNTNYGNIIITNFGAIDPVDYNNTYCVSIYENFNNCITLKELLKQDLSTKELNNIFFQMLFSHAYLNYKLGNFRHNSFTIDSFLIHILDKPTSYNLRLGDIKFKIENTTYLCKLFNYRNSIFDKFNNDIDCIADNPSYDVYMLFKSIIEYTKTINKNFEKIKIIISNFILLEILEENLMTENYFVSKYSQSLIPSQILLKNNFSSNFINMDSKYLKQLKADKKLLGGSFLTDDNHPVNSKEMGKTKKSSKKNSKQKSKQKKMSRENIDVLKKPLTDEEKRKKEDLQRRRRRDDEDENEDDSDENDDNQIDPNEENQNDDLATEGDDDNEKTPRDGDEDKNENGRRRTSKPKKVSKKKSNKSSSQLKQEIARLKNEIRYREEKLKLKEGKDNDSTTLSFNFSDSVSSVKNKLDGNVGSGSLNSKYSMGQQQQGVNRNMNSLLQKIDENQLIPILPEMQQMFDYNQLEAQQQQAFQQGLIPSDNFNGQPQIMDQSIINMARSGKLPLPMANGLQMAPQMPQMAQMAQMAPQMNAKPPLPLLPQFNEGAIQNNQPKSVPVPETKPTENKLTGGTKNYFLKKKI